ncbi:MAG: imm11 family protein, partial [Anaerovoracaceae bacterium]
MDIMNSTTYTIVGAIIMVVTFTLKVRRAIVGEREKMYGMKDKRYKEYLQEVRDSGIEAKVYEISQEPRDLDSETIFAESIYTHEVLRKKGFFDNRIRSGRPIENWDDILHFKYESKEGWDKITDYLPTNLLMDIVSEKFKNMIEENNIKGYQFLPVTKIFERNTGKRLKGYYYAKCINVLPYEAINMDYSIYRKVKIVDEPVAKAGVYVAINIKEIEGHDVFLIKEHERVNTGPYVSQRIVDLIKEYGIIGMPIVETRIYVPEDYIKEWI